MEDEYNEKLRENFKKAMNEIEKDINILIGFASDTDDVERKKFIESLEAKIKYDLSCIQLYRRFN